jgi:HlyD family secretion protein
MSMAEAKVRTSRLWLWIGAGVVILAVFFTLRYSMRDRLPVRVAQITHETLQSTVSTNGRVEPVVNYQFFSPLTTTVKATSAQVGDSVPAGKLLLTLNDIEARAHVAAAESGVKAAQASLDAALHNGTQAERQGSAAEIEQDRMVRDQARHDLDAITRLVSTGAASASEQAAARAKLQSAEASLNAADQNAHHRYSSMEVDRARAALADAQASLASAQHIQAQMAIKAPIAGTIYTMDASPSGFAEAGKLLLEMADLHHQRVRAYFDEPDLGRLALGQKVLIRWDAKPAREWHGHISRLPVTVVTYTTRNVGEVLIDIDDSVDGLLPNTNVTVTVTLSSEPNALSMPREALHEQEGKYFVYRIEHNKLKRVSVTIGAPTLTRVPIHSGLNDGDIVATGTTNAQPLLEGVAIKEVR